MGMFCYQCQETAHNTGCNFRGVCGKTDDLSNIQDFMLFVLRGIAHYAQALRAEGKEVPTSASRFITESLFMTITNANFDLDRFMPQIERGYAIRRELCTALNREIYCCAELECTTWESHDRTEIEEKAKHVGVLRTADKDIRSLRELITYGVKGLAAYLEHAMVLGEEESELYALLRRL